MSIEELMKSYLLSLEANGKRDHKSIRRLFHIYVYELLRKMLKRKANEIEA